MKIIIFSVDAYNDMNGIFFDTWNLLSDEFDKGNYNVDEIVKDLDIPEYDV